MSALQVLIASMNQVNTDLIKSSNICSDAILGNQCAKNEIQTIHEGYREILMLSFSERGVGLNRNNALMRATADICLFADDDMVYVDNYEKIITQAFKELPQADALIFNINTVGGIVKRRINTHVYRVGFMNAMNYGTARLAVKNDSIKKANLCFSRLFGGGAMYSSGEDTLFICDMLKKHLKVYVYPATIATVHQEKSTWFHGYSCKYLYDKGALYRAISRVLAPMISLYFIARHKQVYKCCGLSFFAAYRIMRTGGKNFDRLIPYREECEVEHK